MVFNKQIFSYNPNTIIQNEVYYVLSHLKNHIDLLNECDDPVPVGEELISFKDIFVNMCKSDVNIFNRWILEYDMTNALSSILFSHIKLDETFRHMYIQDFIMQISPIIQEINPSGEQLVVEIDENNILLVDVYNADDGVELLCEIDFDIDDSFSLVQLDDRFELNIHSNDLDTTLMFYQLGEIIDDIQIEAENQVRSLSENDFIILARKYGCNIIEEVFVIDEWVDYLIECICDTKIAEYIVYIVTNISKRLEKDI